jgi:hypothetical protein
MNECLNCRNTAARDSVYCGRCEDVMCGREEQDALVYEMRELAAEADSLKGFDDDAFSAVNLNRAFEMISRLATVLAEMPR